MAVALAGIARAIMILAAPRRVRAIVPPTIGMAPTSTAVVRAAPAAALTTAAPAPALCVGDALIGGAERQVKVSQERYDRQG